MIEYIVRQNNTHFSQAKDTHLSWYNNKKTNRS